MACGAKPVKRERAARQRVADAHHADVLTVVKTLVGKSHGVVTLGAHHQVGQHGREMAHCQVGQALVEQAARVAGCQRHDAHRHAGCLALQNVDQPRHQLGGGGISHGQYKGGAGFSGLKTAGA